MANGNGVTKAKKLVEHPVMASLTTITIVGAALTTLVNVTGWYDKSHTSERELHAVKDELLENDNRQECQAIAIRINLLENTIWQMENAGENSRRLVEKKRELTDLEDKYQDLNCASILR